MIWSLIKKTTNNTKLNNIQHIEWELREDSKEIEVKWWSLWIITMLIVVIFNETLTTTGSCNYTMFHACFVLFCDCNLLKQRIQSRNSLASSLSKLQKMNFMWIIIIFIHSFAISKPFFFFSSLYSYLLLVLCYCYMFVCFQKKNKK